MIAIHLADQVISRRVLFHNNWQKRAFPLGSGNLPIFHVKALLFANRRRQSQQSAVGLGFQQHRHNSAQLLPLRVARFRNTYLGYLVPCVVLSCVWCPLWSN